jgi:hypothetical protein
VQQGKFAPPARNGSIRAVPVTGLQERGRNETAMRPRADCLRMVSQTKSWWENAVMTHSLPIRWLRRASKRDGNRRQPFRQLRRGQVCLEVEFLEERAVPTGTWTPLANPIPSASAGFPMLLLSDGTVMAHGSGPTSSQWYQLTPDASGGYINGTWSTLPAMSTGRFAFTSDVLTDGRVLVLGGEYSGPDGARNYNNTGEIYDPVANLWTAMVNFPRKRFGDDPSEVLPNGDVLGGYIAGPQTYRYDPIRNVWTATGIKLRGDGSDEETWVKLPDESILSYDIFASITHNRFGAQRFVPSTNQWVDASTLDPNNPPGLLSGANQGDELGPACLLPNGNVIFFGANGNTALYTPATDTWTAGPSEPVVSLNGQPTQLVTADAPGAMLPNGHILVALAPLWDVAHRYTFPPPTYIEDFDPTTNTFTDVTPSDFNLDSQPSENTSMLVLPTGQVLLANSSNRLDVFTPDGAPDPTWQPTIRNITTDGNNRFTLTGTQLNGLSEGACFGDDAEMATNYPIVRLTDATGKVAYARTFNWSSTGVATGSTPESVEFSLPAAAASSPLLVSVIANGIASAPVLDIPMDAVNNNLALRMGSSDTASIDILNGGSSLGRFPISSLSSIIVTGSNTQDTIALDNTFRGLPVIVNEGMGHASISVGDESLDAIQSLLTVNGGVNDSLVLNDHGSTSPRTFTVTATTLSWGGPTVHYSGLGSVTITSGTGGNAFNVLVTSADTLLSIAGGGNEDNLIASGTGDLFALAGKNAGTLLGSAYGSIVSFSQIGNLTAASGGDTIQWTPGASLTGNITGGGSSTLDYSNYAGNILVDLQTGFASGVGGSVSGITTVWGSDVAGRMYNLLIGNGGNTLIGGFGRRNILVAGPSASTLIGADGQDLLIGGSTAYDTEGGLSSWQAIAAYWAGSADYATRVANLQSGSGVPLLDPSAVTGNGSGNTFVGYGGMALLYTDGLDNIGLFDPSSQQILVTP